MNLPNLLIDLRSTFSSLLNGSPILMAYLYGSTAEGKTTCLSDVDIALLLDPKHAKGMHPYDRLIFETDIALELEHRIQLPEVDVRIINDAPLLLRGRVIQRGHLLFSSNEDFRIRYETKVLKEYLDFLPIAEQFQSLYFKRRRAELNIINGRMTS